MNGATMRKALLVGFVSGKRPRRCEKKNLADANIRDRKLQSIVNKHSIAGVLNWHFAGTGCLRPAKMRSSSINYHKIFSGTLLKMHYISLLYNRVFGLYKARDDVSSKSSHQILRPPFYCYFFKKKECFNIENK
jgi:hypothetical protein